MDFQQLQIFLTVASLGSFSRAAEVLYMSQPAVSGRIKALEEQLQVLLFDRSRSRELRLTEAGLVFLDYAQRLVNLREEAVHQVSGEDAAPVGVMQIGASTVPGTYLLPPLLARYSRLYPGVRVNLTILDSAAVIEGILAYGFDFGLVGNRVEDKRLQFEPYGDDSLLLVTPPGFFAPEELGEGKQVRVAQTFAATLLLRESGSATRLLLEKALSQRGLSIKNYNSVIYINSLEGIKQAVRFGSGIAFLSRCAVEDYLQAGLVEGFEVEDLDLRRQFYRVRHRARVLSRAASLFLNLLEQKE